MRGKRFINPVVKFKLGGASLELTAQFEVFQTALFYKRNIIIAYLFFVRQILELFNQMRNILTLTIGFNCSNKTALLLKRLLILTLYLFQKNI